MKKIGLTLLILTFFLGACTGDASTPQAQDPSSATASAREAVLSNVVKTVSVRKTSSDESISAQQGMTIFEGGSVETGDDGSVRLDLMPDGTIVRIGPNSSFNVKKLTTENGKSQTTINLLFGKIFIMLKGGSLNVETASGVASVRGSLLSVNYDQKTKRTSATCMEGHCSLLGSKGVEMDLPQGEESFIDDGGDPIDPFPMDRDEVTDWIDENPELDLFMTDMPNPQDFPDLPPDFNGDINDIPTNPPDEPTMESTNPPGDSSTESTPPPSDNGGDTGGGGSGNP